MELIAINSALAGVQPEAFPFVLAALDAIAEPEWNGLSKADFDAMTDALESGAAMEAR